MGCSLPTYIPDQTSRTVMCLPSSPGDLVNTQMLIQQGLRVGMSNQPPDDAGTAPRTLPRPRRTESKSPKSANPQDLLSPHNPASCILKKEKRWENFQAHPFAPTPGLHLPPLLLGTNWLAPT